jgi:1-deoxy-D-xylulose-5-phosphate synthase
VNDLLSTISSPEDLKALDRSLLPRLAAEIRRELVACVSTKGGHLASNLGVVELTIALHRVFRSPVDKIVWDVGHQAYVHKMLTGRRDLLRESLRQMGGISGFPKPQESPHDVFGTGHGSTSVSAALGIAKARDIKGEDYFVISVTGDGSMTGGLALEAMNHAAQENTDLIVILNDNGMSIAKSVGGIAQYLRRIRLDPSYLRVKREFESLMHLTSLGSSILEAVEKLKGGMKRLMPGGFFEELGFTYVGPVDGHDLPEMEKTLQGVKGLKGPVLVHVVTQKGKGYEPAENDAARFHGIGCFDIESGEQRQDPEAPPTYTSIFSNAIAAEARRDKRIVAICAAMPDGTGLDSFAREFPDRFFDVGMAEGHAVTLAAGLASQGLRPVVGIYSTFLQRAFDQILHDVCIQNLPVVFAVDRAGIVGEDGPTHQGTFDLSYLAQIPNMTVAAPKDDQELCDLLHTAIAHQGPFAIRYARGQALGIPLREPEVIAVGTAEVLREGSDCAILAIGTMVAEADRAASLLSERGVSAQVTNLRYAKPLDAELLRSLASRFKVLATVEENSLWGGIGWAIGDFVSGLGQEGVHVVRIGIPDEFVEHGLRRELLAKYGLSAEGIAQRVISALGRFGREGAVISVSAQAHSSGVEGLRVLAEEKGSRPGTRFEEEMT